MSSRPKRTCRVCGKEYDGCCTPNPTGVFRWRDVACSPECGAIYLDRINQSRGIGTEPKQETVTESPQEDSFSETVNLVIKEQNDEVESANDEIESPDKIGIQKVLK